LEDLRKQKTYFVRPAGVPLGTDVKEYDVGNLFAITQGVTTAGAVLGELYVEYDVLLMTPVLESFSSTGFASSAGPSTITNILPAPVTTGGNIQVSPFGNVISLSGLSIGSEYALMIGCSGSITFSAPVGLTLRTTTNNGAAICLQTYVATAIAGSITATASGAATSVLFDIILLSPAPTF